MDSKKFQEAFAKAREDREENRDDGLPVGRYQAFVDEAWQNVSQGGQGREQVCFSWVVAEENGELVGEKHTQYQGLDHPVSISILEGMFQRMGYDTSAITPESLKEILEDISARKPFCVISITEKNGFKNVRLNTFVGFSVVAVEEEEEAPPEPPKPKVKTKKKKVVKATPTKEKAPEEEPPPPSEEPPEEPEKEEEPEGTWEIGIGTVVQFAYQEKQFEGEVVDMNEDKGTLSIKSGAKTFTDIGQTAIIDII